FTLCEPFQQCCHTSRQRFTVNCVLSALDINLRAARENATTINLSWAVNERNPAQRFFIMRKANLEEAWKVLHVAEGEVYAYTDRGLLPGRYFYQVSQSMPTGSVFLSNIAEAVLLPEGSQVLVEQQVRAVSEEALVIWSFPEEAGKIEMRLTDVAGRIIHTFRADQEEGSISIPSPPSAGIYILQVDTPAGTQSFRLIWQ
ncbi:MAG: T9SS type A sorting domain-containing protein, partial [Bacteroidia bacterium]|nr:T9SS type A sorting domain-containing protein [Bacteroidia bacterium]